jgi:DNA-directed RNA polymerase specialized sigma24 family protein
VQSASGEDERDEALFAALYPDLRRFAAVCAPSTVDPDDLVQEALANTLSRGRLNEIRDLRAYLLTAIANRGHASFRNRDSQLPPDGRDAGASDAYPSDLSDLSRLAATDRAALFLVDVEGMEVRAAAHLLSTTPAALRARLVRARRRLRSALRTEESG